jgi:Family of unknown function (DUF5677)
MTAEQIMTFGIPEEWEWFQKTYRLFLDRFPNLQRALEAAFAREATTSEPVDRVVFFSGRLCVEDFMEVLLLCANGYGAGALKILRGMYERVVTARYLHKIPAETEDFVDFYWVTQHRLVQSVVETFGAGGLEQAKLDEINANSQQVRGRFMVDDCKSCGTKRLNHTWSKLDMVSMARAAGGLGRLVVPGYYLPTVEAHSTVGAIMSRLMATEGGGAAFDGGPQRSKVGIALPTAHNLLLNVLALQQEHFGLDSLPEALQVCVQDFQEIWKRADE